MGVIATAVRHLIAAGVTGEALVAAIEEMETAGNSSGAPDNSSGNLSRIEKIRAYDRQRKAAKRDALIQSETPVDGQATSSGQTEIPSIPAERGTIGGNLPSFLPDSGKKDLEIQHAREPDEVDVLAAEWNSLAEELGLPKVQHLTETRRKAARKRLTEAGGMEGIRALAFPKIRASTGLQGKAGGRKWKANFDWLLQQSSFTKLMEGGYDHWQKPKSDLMEAADRLRERLGEKHRQDAQGRGAAGLFDSPDGTGDLRDDHLCY